MESELSQPLIEQVEHEQIIVIERQAVEVANTMCGTGCGFSDMQHRAKDAEIRSSATRKLCLATVLCLIFIAVEVAGGLIANSLAILTDAAHLLSDVAGFAISLFAIWAARWEATPRQTYGFFRLEILGALVSIQLIWLLTGVLVYEAIARLYNSSRLVDGRLMFIVASFGLCCNLIMVFLFGHYDHEHGHGSHGHSHGHHHTEASHGHSHSNHHTEGNPEYNQNECHSDKGHNHRHLHDSHNENYVQNHGTFQENYDHSGLGIKHFPVLANEENSQPVFGYMNDTCSIKGDRRHESHGRLEVSSPAKKSQKSLVPSNINVRGAYLHVFGDLIQSIGVMIGGAIIWAKPLWRIVDLICTFFFSILVLGTTIRMLRDIVEILMESTPREIDAIKLEKGLLEVPGVVAIHELHIWAITMGKTSLACHVIIDLESDADAILQKVIEFCEKGFNIRHVTVQIERAH